MPLGKYVAEANIVLAFDFKNQDEIAINGETLASVVSITITPLGGAAPLTLGATSIVGTQARIVISGGQVGATYDCVALVLTSAGKTLEARTPLVMLD